MPVIINPESEYAKELAKWESHPTRACPEPGRPYRFAEYPRMLYKAALWPRSGKPAVTAPEVSPFGWLNADQYQQALAEAERFGSSCQRIVGDESEWLVAKGQGWCESPKVALEQFEREQQAIAAEAANAAFHAQRMTENARREFAAAEDATSEHVTDVVARKKPGPKPKAQPSTE